MKQWARRLLGYDVETTGTSNEARIVEFGAVLVDEGKVVTSWSMLLRPQGVDWSDRHVQEAMRINGITPEDLRHRKTFAEEFCYIRSALMQSDVRVGHNFKFDSRMLGLEFKRAVARGELAKDDMKLDRKFITLDTLALDYHLFPNEKRHTLEHVAARWGVHNWQKHRAIGDADACIRVLQAMSEHLPDDVDEVDKISKRCWQKWNDSYK